MFHSICKSLPHVKHSLRALNPQNLYILQISLSSTLLLRKASKPISENENLESFTVSYFINTCGFSPERAVSASRYVSFDKPDKPNAVISFLREYGFTESQITSLVRRFPPVILCDPNKTLLPKIEFFETKGFKKEDISVMLSRTPNIFKRSLEKQIIPSYNVFCSLMDSDKKTLNSLKRFGYMLCCDLNTAVLPNIEFLRELGVPDSHISTLLTYQPRDMMMDTSKFRLIAEEVKTMGFDPARLKFLIAIHAFRAMNKVTWEKKVEVYKKWGWSKDDIILAFVKNPWCMMVSTDKITKVMDFFVNELRLGTSVLMNRPSLISLSLEKRIIPRCHVYQFLREKGLLKKNMKLNLFLEVPERMFAKRFLEIHAKKAPELLELYEKKSWPVDFEPPSAKQQ